MTRASKRESLPSRPVRLAPLSDAELGARARQVVHTLVAPPTVNIYRSIIRHPDAAAAMVNLGRTLRGGDIPPKHREILILRTGWKCSSPYELAQHRRLGIAAGMDDEDMERIKSGPDDPGWDPFEATLCRLADELHDTSELSDATWSALAAVYEPAQIVQALMLVGYYHLVSFVLNGLGVPVEDGVDPFPA